MDFLAGETLTLRKVTTTKDARGNKTYSKSDTSWAGCLVAPRFRGSSTRFSTESADFSEPTIVVGQTVYGPATVTIDADDEIVIGGVVWQVDGLPAEWPWPTGGRAGLEVQLKRAGNA